MAKVATGVKHKIGAFWEAAAAGAPDIGVLLLISAGLEDENVLADRDTVAAILATTSDEATFTNYARKTVTPATTRDDAADSVTLTLAGAPPLIIDWPAAGGAGGLGTNNVLGRVVFFYDPTPGSSTDAQKIHLASMPITATTDGSTVRVTIPPSGIATYRDGAGSATGVSTSSTPGDGTVSDATVATGAGISLDKTADSATRLAMTGAERTKLGTLASGGVTPDGSVTNAKVAAAAAIDLDKTADSATRLAMSAAERTKLAGVATGADNSVEPDVQVFPANGTWNKPAGATTTTIEAWGGGGGAGAGARRASGTLSTGGSGGCGGANSKITIPTALLGATETVTIGAAGVGAPAVTADNTNGAAGTNGGNTTFGNKLRAGGGGGGGGGSSTGSSTVGSTGTGTHNGGTGAVSSATGGAGSTGNSGAAAGGGSGAGLATTPANAAGGAGAASSTNSTGTAGTAGASGGGTGGNGTSTAGASDPVGGPSGGGGGSSTTAAGGAGGNGAGFGSGGGGGAGSLNTFNSGKGGDGRPGYLVATSW